MSDYSCPIIANQNCPITLSDFSFAYELVQNTAYALEKIAFILINYTLGIDDHLYDLGPRGAPEGSSFESPSVRFELENFNVRTFYDKLEDQTLHVSSQLARHQADLRAFYDRISQQAEKLKGMLDSMDVSALIKATKEAGRTREGEV